MGVCQTTKNSRRDFIRKTSVAAGLGPIFGSQLLAEKSSTVVGKKLGIALVGLGYYSSDLLAPALQNTRDCYLSGIVTGSKSKAKEWMRKYKIPEPNVYNYKNFDKIVSNEDIDVVYVVLPNDMHAEYTLRAAKAGKHVICEKPMAMNVKECETMIKACEDNGVGLSIGYRMRYTRIAQEIARLGRNKVYGDVMMINSAAGFYQSDKKGWRFKRKHGGGPLMDIGIYALQGARYSIGEEPIAVTAQSYNTRPKMFKQIAETITFQLNFPSGAIANCTGSFGMQVGNLFVQAKDGWYRQNRIWQYAESSGESIDGPIEFPHRNQQAQQMDAQCRAFRDKTPQLITGKEGLQDMRIIEAIYKSLNLGGKTVNI